MSESAADSSRAFDKVPHKRLNYKLKLYGIRGDTLEWITVQCAFLLITAFFTAPLEAKKTQNFFSLPLILWALEKRLALCSLMQTIVLP